MRLDQIQYVTHDGDMKKSTFVTNHRNAYTENQPKKYVLYRTIS